MPDHPRAPTAVDDPAHAAEGFIPLRRAVLIAMLNAEPGQTEEDRAGFSRLAEILSARLHFEFHAVLEELKAAYAPFDPDADADTDGDAEVQQGDSGALAQRLVDRFSWLLERANFRRLTRDDIHDAMDAASQWGVNLYVDFDIFEQLEVYARGERVDRRRLRRWWGWRAPLEVDVPLYRRLVVLFRLKDHDRLAEGEDADTVYIKVFKNIPRVDLDMLLPSSRVRMSLLDRGKIIVPTLSGGVLTILKLVQTIVAVTTLGTLAILGVITGSVGYGLRSFHGWLRTQQRYQLNLTRRLYYQNLDNNAGAFFRLLDEAEEQETREILLAWHVLWRQAGDAGWTVQQLDRAAEALLRRRVACEVAFEEHDALAKLVRLGIVERLPGDRYRAATIATALARLDGAWDQFFRYTEKS